MLIHQVRYIRPASCRWKGRCQGRHHVWQLVPSFSLPLLEKAVIMYLHPSCHEWHECTHTHATGLGFLHICNSLESDTARTAWTTCGIAVYWKFMHWDILVIYLFFVVIASPYISLSLLCYVHVLPKQIWNKCIATTRNVCVRKKASGLKLALPHGPKEWCVRLCWIWATWHNETKNSKKETPFDYCCSH